jgi:hypothetical protein
MVNDISFKDEVEMDIYIYIIELFISKQINATVFDELFIQIRSKDTYWMSGAFDKRIGKILDSFFLDIDEYNPDELYDPNDKFNINGDELRIRAIETLTKLKELVA